MVDIRLESMTQGQYETYRQAGPLSYAKHISKTGITSLSEAEERAEAEYQKLLPDGILSAGQYLFAAYVGGTEVGTVWLHLAESGVTSRAWIVDLWVHESRRRRGYGRAIVQEAERWCRGRGVEQLSLSIFSGNDGTRFLFEGEKYLPVVLQMSKLL
ncbi:GNAT family N-acetyltransferase [Paractinoplanes brasiliensis]|uniref:Acetyltransferase (GNAT) family protein n=1 Tax=Paractinoplanes brasiliensis TaxID=52695 RepID=A0A4R6JAF4_9ACTN|nr:GNAT family N-acetyltransferase [Actinoplanes brasiliensis]TDO32629.1 acetyltransferase (GNAT) family protein [Actinoplanes brasiliensis]GID33469.1 N-acetyltransferase [Actinoplanes brasiliensis]